MPARLINSHSTRLPGRADRRSIARFSAVRLPHLARTVAPEHRLRPNLATSDSRFVEPLQRDLFESDFAVRKNGPRPSRCS